MTLVANTQLTKFLHDTHPVPSFFESPGHMFFPTGLNVTSVTPTPFNGECSMCENAPRFIVNSHPLCVLHASHTFVVFEQQAHQAQLTHDVTALLGKQARRGLSKDEKERLSHAWTCMLSGYTWMANSARTLPARTKPGLRDFRTGEPMLPGETEVAQEMVSHIFVGASRAIARSTPEETATPPIAQPPPREVYDYAPFGPTHKPYPDVPSSLQSAPIQSTLISDAFYQRDPTALRPPLETQQQQQQRRQLHSHWSALLEEYISCNCDKPGDWPPRRDARELDLTEIYKALENAAPLACDEDLDTPPTPDCLRTPQPDMATVFFN
jgi:hypothetical protein